MLALIAGTGRLPVLLRDALIAKANPPLVCAMHGFQPEIAVDVDFRLETLGSLLADLKSRGVSQVCMAGAVKRPRIEPSLIDELTMPLVAKLQASMALGDDGTLRGIIEIFDEFGISVVGASDLCPEFLPKSGSHTKRVPTDEESAATDVGRTALIELGRADSGQACVIQNGMVISTEGVAGTDAMIEELGNAGNGAILYKAPKPNQDRRVDLPVIGPETVRNTNRAGFEGIIIEGGGVMILDYEEVLEILNNNAMFLLVTDR